MSLVSSTPGTKPAPMPWILCGPGLPPDSTGDSAGSTATSCLVQGVGWRRGVCGVMLPPPARACTRAHASQPAAAPGAQPAAHLDVGVFLLEEAPGARDGPARAHAADEHVHLALRLAPDLGPGGLKVHARVVGVFKLLQDERVGRVGRNLLRLGHGTLCVWGGGEGGGGGEEVRCWLCVQARVGGCVAGARCMHEWMATRPQPQQRQRNRALAPDTRHKRPAQRSCHGVAFQCGDHRLRTRQRRADDHITNSV
jgi:hypothetical protein